jgi:hypothetical protein
MFFKLNTDFLNLGGRTCFVNYSFFTKMPARMDGNTGKEQISMSINTSLL